MDELNLFECFFLAVRRLLVTAVRVNILSEGHLFAFSGDSAEKLAIVRKGPFISAALHSDRNRSLISSMDNSWLSGHYRCRCVALHVGQVLILMLIWREVAPARLRLQVDCDNKARHAFQVTEIAPDFRE